MKLIKLKKFRIASLIVGVVVSWYATISAFITFYNNEGTLFKIKDCIQPNPVTTPCFWGAFAFVVALYLSVKKYKSSSSKFEKYFLYFMVCCVLFAWGNFAIEVRGVEPVPGALIAPCPATSANPFLTPCFAGSILFTVSLIVTYLMAKINND